MHHVHAPNASAAKARAAKASAAKAMTNKPVDSEAQTSARSQSSASGESAAGSGEWEGLYLEPFDINQLNEGEEGEGSNAYDESCSPTRMEMEMGKFGQAGFC